MLAPLALTATQAHLAAMRQLPAPSPQPLADMAALATAAAQEWPPAEACAAVVAAAEAVAAPAASNAYLN